MTARRVASLPIHPLLVACYAVVFLYGQNAGEANPRDAIAPLVGSVVFVATALALATAVLRDPRRAGILTTALAILFFGFGHVLGAIDSPLLTSGRLLVAWLVIGGIAIVVAWRLGRGRDLRNATARLNAIAAIFVAVALVPAIGGELGRPTVAGAAPVASPAAGEGSAGPNRDIYLIVVEDIGSERILRDQWGLSGSSPFAFLDELGFARVADSHANYGKTGHSLASLLNLVYLDDLVAQMGSDSDDYSVLYDLLDDAAVPRLLQERGYQYVHVGSWWDPTARSSIADVNLGLETPSDFSTAFLDTTMLPAVTSRLAKVGIRIGVEGLEAHELQYRSAIAGFDALSSILGRPGRTFTFAHLLIPHDPYVFAADGTFVTDEQRASLTREEQFLDQARYTMSGVEEFVRAALAGPDEDDPIIIVTTDEGPSPLAFERHPDTYDWEQASDADLREKFEIELALYLPGVDPTVAGVHRGMSLVNTFRTVFDAYFGTSYGQLADRSFVYRDKAHPYRLTEITDRLMR